MAKENSAGLGVSNVYGPRTTEEGRAGVLNTAGVVKELRVSFTGSTYSFATATIPAGAKILDAYAKVDAVFGGLTDLDVGTSGSATTNGVDVDVSATGYQDLTPIGTWAAILAADTVVKVEAVGTATGTGSALVVIRYVIVS